ncbi:hypothetical protein GF319_05205 [Candidatus Bathyarchaeota archaeon]|nr:hypothetical protein [Candidatus Bathyarchaeota archaeon]
MPIHRISLVVGLGFMLFMLGYLSWYTTLIDGVLYLNQEQLVEYTALFLTLITVVGFSYRNQSLTGGLVTGASLSLVFWLGFMLRTIEIYRDPLLNSLKPLRVIRIYGPGALTSVLAFTFIGAFFGLLGYVYDRFFIERPVEEAYVFRDYWSNVYSMGKNTRREFIDLDQRLALKLPWNLNLQQWWERMAQSLTEKKPELLFSRQKKRKQQGTPSLMGKGDVYDVSTGRRIAEGVIDPLYLSSKYRPSILEMPSLSTGVGGGRRLALEELVSRFLGWFIGSRYLLVFYIMLSSIMSALIIRFYRVEYGLLFVEVFTQWGTLDYWLTNFMDVMYVIASCILVSGLILYFVYRWRSLSMDLYDERPDERTLIFSVYICFIIGYWMSYRFITEPPYIIFGGDFVASWLVWAKWFFLLTLILGLAYIFIHRESEVSNIYLYQTGSMSQGEIYPYRDKEDEPYWLGEEGNLFWVLRYMYYWPMEITVAPHPDWERIEVWVNAVTGEPRWVVSDYHYRELWYRVDEDLGDRLVAGLLLNFHTPIPLVKKDDINAVEYKARQPAMRLLQMMLLGHSGDDIPYSEGENPWSDLHPPEWISNYGLKGPTASFCGNLKWSHWRYPWGVDDIERYSKHPATLPEEQPDNYG